MIASHAVSDDDFRINFTEQFFRMNSFISLDSNEFIQKTHEFWVRRVVS